MKKIIYGFLLFTAALSVVSCGNGSADQTILGYTTDNTLAILKLNVEELSKKLPKEQILKDESGKMSEKNKKQLKLLLDGDNGLDTGKPVYLMVDQEDKEFAISVFAWVKDKDKFTATFSEISGDKVEIKDDYIYAKDQLAGSIKGDMMVFAFNMSNPMDRTYGGGYSTGTAEREAPKSFYTAFWERKQTENDNRIKQIEKSLEGNTDLSGWIDVYGVVNTVSKGYIKALSINKLLTDASIGGSLSFEKGKVQIKSNTFFNEEMQKLIDKYYSDNNIDYGIVKNIELDNAKAFGLGNFSTDMLKYLVQESGFESAADSFLGSMGLTFSEACDAFNGKYAYVSYKDEVATEPEEEEEVVVEPAVDGEEDTDDYDYEEDAYADYDYNYSKPNFLIALGINGNKADKIIEMINNEPSLAGMYKVWNNDEMIVVCADEKDLELLKSGKSANNKVLDKKSGLNAYTWASGEDYTKIIQMGRDPKAGIKSMESESKVKDGNFTSEITLKLDKDKESALYYIMGYE